MKESVTVEEARIRQGRATYQDRPGLALPLRSGGALPTKVSSATRRLTSGPNRRQRSIAPPRCQGVAKPAEQERGGPSSQGPSPISCGRYRRKSGRRLGTSRTKYRLPKSQEPDGTVDGSTKRLASRFYQIKTGQCLTGQYLNLTTSQPTPRCWWCRYAVQTREHLFRECPEWKRQQKGLWAELKRETGKRKDRWKVRDILADKRCVQAVLDFLATTDVGRLALPLVEDDAVSAVSEMDKQEWMEEQGGGG